MFQEAPNRAIPLDRPGTYWRSLSRSVIVCVIFAYSGHRNRMQEGCLLTVSYYLIIIQKLAAPCLLTQMMKVRIRITISTFSMIILFVVMIIISMMSCGYCTIEVNRYTYKNGSGSGPGYRRWDAPCDAAAEPFEPQVYRCLVRYDGCDLLFVLRSLGDGSSQPRRPIPGVGPKQEVPNGRSGQVDLTPGDVKVSPQAKIRHSLHSNFSTHESAVPGVRQPRERFHTLGRKGVSRDAYVETLEKFLNQTLRSRCLVCSLNTHRRLHALAPCSGLLRLMRSG